MIIHRTLYLALYTKFASPGLEIMFQKTKIALAGFCLLCLAACDSQPDVQFQDNTLTTSLPAPVRQIASLGTLPLEIRINVNGTLASQRRVSNDISENIDFEVDVPADQANIITVEWLAIQDGTRVLLADSTFRTQPNQESAVASNYNDDVDERFDFDGDGRFNIEEARENRNLLSVYDLEVPFQTNFVAAREVLTPGTMDSDSSFGRDNNTSRAETNTDENSTFSVRHDGTNLIVYVCGRDQELLGDDTLTNGRYWHDDTVFLYIDGADSNNMAYDNLDDFQLAFVRSTQEMIVSKGGNNPFCPDGNCVFHQFVDPANNTQCLYELNISAPFEDLNITLGEAAGFDLEITDDDDGGLREGSSGFIGFSDDSSTDPSTFGTIILR